MSLEEFLHYLLLSLGLASVVLTASVVWRVEKKLDVAVKLLLAANVSFTVGIALDLLVFYGVVPAWDWGKLVKVLFLFFFTLGMFELRALVIDLEEQRRRSGPHQR